MTRKFKNIFLFATPAAPCVKRKQEVYAETCAHIFYDIYNAAMIDEHIEWVCLNEF